MAAPLQHLEARSLVLDLKRLCHLIRCPYINITRDIPAVWSAPRPPIASVRGQAGGLTVLCTSGLLRRVLEALSP